MAISTADLSDEHSDKVEIVEPLFRDFGGSREFAGPISTLKLFEDNSLVREVLSSPGHGGVLVVDGGGSMRCALVGDQLAELAVKNGWSGVLVYGCIRDAEAISRLGLGVKALGTHPRKSHKRGEGQKQIPVRFGGVTFVPGHYVYADQDGVLVSPSRL